MRILTLLILLISFCNAKVLKVGYINTLPLSFTQNDKVVGFDVDFLTQCTNAKDVTFEYIKVSNVTTLIDMVSSDSLDIGISGISMTGKRLKKIPLTIPYLEGGIAVLSNVKTKNIFQLIGDAFIKASDGLLLLVVFIVICALVVWEPKKGGVKFFDGIYWANVTMTTVGYGDITPKSTIDKILSIFIMWIGIFVISPYFIARMNEAVLNSTTNSVITEKDLRSGNVLTIAGTTSSDWLTSNGIKHTTIDSVDEAIEVIESKKFDYLVFDNTVLNYIKKKMTVSSNTFIDEQYSFVIKNDTLREYVDSCIVDYRRSENYKNLLDKWLSK